MQMQASRQLQQQERKCQQRRSPCARLCQAQEAIMNSAVAYF